MIEIGIRKYNQWHCGSFEGIKTPKLKKVRRCRNESPGQTVGPEMREEKPVIKS